MKKKKELLESKLGISLIALVWLVTLMVMTAAKVHEQLVSWGEYGWNPFIAITVLILVSMGFGALVALAWADKL